MSESTTPSNIFPARLRAARELRELNQEQLAHRASLKASAISHFETGNRKPSFDNLKKLANALNVTTDYLVGRVDDPAGLAGAAKIYRHLGQLKGTDRKTVEDMIEMLVKRAEEQNRQGRVVIADRSRNEIAAFEAEELIRELEIDSLPIDPVAIAESLGILVHPKATSGGVSGMLLRVGNEFGIVYATHIENEGFKRFCIAHEIGHYRIPGHLDAVLAHGNVHESHAGFVQGNPYEREADYFAASLLMPDVLFAHEMRSLGDGLKAVEALSELCVTSLLAAANRYIQKADIPAAMIISTGPNIEYCFMSDPLQDFEHLEWPLKDQQIPADSETAKFNEALANIQTAQRAEAEVDLQVWLGGERNIPGTEEIVGLGRYGKTLTILTSEVFADDENEQDDLQESWEPKFRR